MSMWANYQKEVWGFETLENEKGFVSYQVLEDAIFITDIYVEPDFRRSGIAWEFADEIAEMARAQGKQRLLGRVDVTQADSATSLKAQLAYGFVPFSAEQGKIWLRKELI